MNKLLTISLLILAGSTIQAQDLVQSCDKAESFFQSFKEDCAQKVEAHNCVHLDITDSYDFEGKEFLFRWDMGDGNVLDGLEVRHCYENPGMYTASLTLVDPITKIALEDELKTEIVLKGSFEITSDVPSSAEIGLPVELGYKLDYPEVVYEIEEVYWYFGDGNFSCEKQPTYTYQGIGQFQINLIVKLRSEMDTQYLCASDTIEITLPDPSQGLLTDVFDSLKVASRFLEDEVTYLLLAKEASSFVPVIDYSTVKGGQTYQLVVFRGNQLFSSEEMNTPTEASLAEVNEIINLQAAKLASQQPSALSPIFFELDQQELSRKQRKILDENIELLLGFPMVKVEVGVYTNSTGSIAKTVELSKKRGGLIKSYMMDQGVPQEQVEVIDPGRDRSLINTCQLTAVCDFVDPSLDRRTDFKISLRAVE